MKKLIVKDPPKPVKQTNAVSSQYSRALHIAYGTIESNNDNGTTNVTLKTGWTVEGIRIPSENYPSKDPVIGGISYPQVGAEVIIEYPEGDINSGYIKSAGLDFTDQSVKDALPSGKKLILGGWEQTYDQKTGEVTFTNNSNSIHIDPANDIIEIFGTIKVARINDTTIIDVLTDPAFITWMAAVSTATGVGAPPTTVAGKIDSGSDKVKVG